MTSHQTLKSSVFCPAGGKLTSQLLIHDHLVSHYKKLEKVRPTVDTTPPKTWLARKKGHSMSARVPSPLATYHHHLQQQLTSNGYDTDDTLQQKSSLAVNQRYNSGNRPSSASNASRTQHQQSSGYDTESGLQAATASQSWRATIAFYMKTGVNPPKYDGNDLIEKHREYFKEEKLFTPRTLQISGKSKLSSLPSCYNKPRRSRSSVVSAMDKLTATDKADVGNNEHVDVNVTQARSCPNTGPALSDSLVNETLCSRDERLEGTPTGVPPLNISLDADHLLWLKEQQSQRSRLRSPTGKRLGGTLSSQTDVEHSKTLTGHLGLSTLAHMQLTMSSTRHLNINDEHQKYQDFVQEVTTDVLDRGIFTNWGLKQAFESHINKKIGELDESKMRELLEDLRKKLGIPLEHESNGYDFGFGSTLRPVAYQKLDESLNTKPKSDDISVQQASRVGRPPLPKTVPRISQDDNVKISKNAGRPADILTISHDSEDIGRRGSPNSDPDIMEETPESEGFDELDSHPDLGKTAVVLQPSMLLSNSTSYYNEPSAESKQKRFHRKKEMLSHSESLQPELSPNSHGNNQASQDKRDFHRAEFVATTVEQNSTKTATVSSCGHESVDGSEEDDFNETNELLLDTITEYQQKLEQTNFKDEISADESDTTQPKDSKERLKVPRDANIDRSGSASDSIDVSDLDENEIIS